MCPVCLSTAALIAGSVTSTGGLAAFALRMFGRKPAADTNVTPNPAKEDHHVEQHTRSR